MSFAKCSDVVSLLVDEANDQFGIAWRVNKNAERVLSKDCVLIDAIFEEFNGISYEVNIDEITMDIAVSLMCNEIIVESPSHKLYEVLKHTKKFSIKKAPNNYDESIILDFIFPGIWEKTY